MPKLDDNRDFGDRMERCLWTLLGLAVGDAFGQLYNFPDDTKRYARRELPEPPWRCSGITILARAVTKVLSEERSIDQELLARRFAERYHKNPTREFSRVVRKILADLNLGHPWQEVSRQFFQGLGSMGNGAAAWVAPVGAYYADDFQAATEQARLMAMVTHAHPEGQAGAMAVAASCVKACRIQTDTDPLRGRSLLDAAIAFTPEGPTRQRLVLARQLWRCESVGRVAPRIGCGGAQLAHDTVPFALWCAAKCTDDFREALWLAHAGLGDQKTTCAIVGGIISQAMPIEELPGLWFHAIEKLSEL